MQTRKKMLAGNGSREHFCRQMPNVAVICERKVSELISSTKKKKLVEIHSRRHEQERELSAGRDLSEDVAGDISDDVSVACQDIQETIFSPSFFHSKHACGSIPAKVDFLDAFTEKDKEGHNEKFIEDKMQIEHMQEDHGNVNLVVNPSNHSNVGNINGDVLHIESLHVKSLCEDEFSAIGDLSPEVSAIYLAMQHSKLECVDEKSQDSISEEVSVETEDDDFDDFDPYLFIKDLPNLSVVVPKFRSMLLPKKTRSCPSTTLVLDLDETLVHSTLEPCGDADFAFPVNFNLKEHTIYVWCCPFLKDFIERVATLFETIIFTASQSIYAEQLLNMLDPKRKLFRHRVFRESCVYVEGNYLKDLSILGRDLAHVIIIDNSRQATHKIRDIIRGNFNALYVSWKKIPIRVRDMWFREFERDFQWQPQHHDRIRRNFERRGSSRLADMFTDIRRSGQQPLWIGERVWAGLLVAWGSEEYAKKREQNKHNRAAQCHTLSIGDV